MSKIWHHLQQVLRCSLYHRTHLPIVLNQSRNLNLQGHRVSKGFYVLDLFHRKDNTISIAVTNLGRVQPVHHFIQSYSGIGCSEYCCYFRYVIAFDYCVDILRISQLYTFCIYDIPSLRGYLVTVDEMSD